MKNRINLTGLLLILCFACCGQKQRMAVLPSSMNYGQSNTLKTLCIDYFREAPAVGDFYNDILSFDRADKKWVKKIGGKYQIEGFEGVSEMKLKDKEGNVLIPENIKQPLITGQENEKIPDRYLEFINNKIEQYRRIAIDNNQAFDEYSHNELQNEIWEYNVLDNLGYIKNQDKIELDLSNGLNHFNDDWGINNYWGIMRWSVAENLKVLHELNKVEGEAYKTFVVTKSHKNEYVVFDGVSKPLFRGNSEVELSNFFNATLSQNENAYLILNNFENVEKQEPSFQH